MDDRISKISIDVSDTISFALQKMDIIEKKLLLVFSGSAFKGILSIGDIQRAILANKPLSTKIGSILRSQFRYASENTAKEDITAEMLKFRCEFMPIVNPQGELVDVIFWEDQFNDKFRSCRQKFNLPIVIMAGGVGSRMKPLTNVFPKPLIPIGDKTIIEEILDRFVYCGSNSFYLSVNYKARLIKSYFDQLDNLNYQLHYFQEEKPLGTAGSLSLLKGQISSTFFVSNCDIIIDEDYSQILEYHRSNNNLLTMVTAIQSVQFPYGVIETGNNGLLTKVNEKPDISIKINTGMYILEPELLEEIPEGVYFQITTLMDNIIKRGGKVGCFPVNNRSWIDIGTWEGYLRYIKINEQ